VSESGSTCTWLPKPICSDAISFTGGAKDENKPQDIDKINETFKSIAARVGEIVAAHA
jgi:hypothetical protein